MQASIGQSTYDQELIDVMYERARERVAMVMNVWEAHAHDDDEEDEDPGEKTPVEAAPVPAAAVEAPPSPRVPPPQQPKSPAQSQPPVQQQQQQQQQQGAAAPQSTAPVVAATSGRPTSRVIARWLVDRCVENAMFDAEELRAKRLVSFLFLFLFFVFWFGFCFCFFAWFWLVSRILLSQSDFCLLISPHRHSSTAATLCCRPLPR
jgi:hypothetical protein